MQNIKEKYLFFVKKLHNSKKSSTFVLDSKQCKKHQLFACNGPVFDCIGS